MTNNEDVNIDSDHDDGHSLDNDDYQVDSSFDDDTANSDFNENDMDIGRRIIDDIEGHVGGDNVSNIEFDIERNFGTDEYVDYDENTTLMITITDIVIKMMIIMIIIAIIAITMLLLMMMSILTNTVITIMMSTTTVMMTIIMMVRDF